MPQSSTAAHPSLINPHAAPSWVHVLATQVPSSHTLGCTAPHISPVGHAPHESTVPHRSTSSPQEAPSCVQVWGKQVEPSLPPSCPPPPTFVAVPSPEVPQETTKQRAPHPTAPSAPCHTLIMLRTSYLPRMSTTSGEFNCASRRVQEVRIPSGMGNRCPSPCAKAPSSRRLAPMSAAVWNFLGPPLPPAGRGSFASDGRDGIVLFLQSDKGPELRRWTGTDLALVTSKPFGDGEYVDAFFGCFDPRSNGMLLFGLHSDGLLTVPESGGAVQLGPERYVVVSREQMAGAHGWASSPGRYRGLVRHARGSPPLGPERVVASRRGHLAEGWERPGMGRSNAAL